MGRNVPLEHTSDLHRLGSLLAHTYTRPPQTRISIGPHTHTQQDIYLGEDMMKITKTVGGGGEDTKARPKWSEEHSTYNTFLLFFQRPNA